MLAGSAATGAAAVKAYQANGSVSGNTLIGENVKDINGLSYSCPALSDINKAEMFLIFRSYMEPSTRVSPDDNELLYDQAIHFSP